MTPRDHVYQFGPFRLFPAKRRLLKDDREISLTPKVFDLLMMFVAHPGDLLDRDRLMREIWPRTIVEESNLTQSVFVLRRALGNAGLIVTVPGRGYCFTPPVTVVGGDGTSDAPEPAALAVLPFKPLGVDAGLGFLGTGIADAIIGALSRSLVVRPTAAVLKFAGIAQDPTAAGRELRVDAVLDGTIQQAGGRLRVSAQLVRVATGTTTWAGTFDADATDPFAVQDAIADRVASELKLETGASAVGRVGLYAWREYIRGRYFQDRRVESGLALSIDHARRAIAAEPGFAMGHVCLADAYNLLGQYLYLPSNEAFAAARAAVDRALALDASSAEAHASMAEILFFRDRDWKNAEREYRTAIRLNPNYAAARHWYAWFLMCLDRHDEALDQLWTAQRIDPCSPAIETALGLPFFYTRRYAEAATFHRKALEMDPHFSAAQYYLAATLIQQGEYSTALAALGRVVPEHAQQAVAMAGYAAALAGRPAEAEATLAKLDALGRERYVSPYCRAWLDAGLGRIDAALDALDAAVAENAAWLVFLKIDPFLDRLRRDRRFRGLLARAGFDSPVRE